MASRIKQFLEVMAMALLPAGVLALFAVVLGDALAARAALITALATLPFWAQAYLVLVCTTAVGLTLVALGFQIRGRVGERVELGRGR